jgi:hypothetical protein
LLNVVDVSDLLRVERTTTPVGDIRELTAYNAALRDDFTRLRVVTPNFGRFRPS